MANQLPASIQDISERRSRPQRVADEIKDWIVARGLQPGDRLPAENELMAEFEMAKGTIREAVRLLEAQGLVKTRTGPGGGAFINAPSETRAQALLSNYFYFKNLSINDIYELRILLEPELAAGLAGHLTKEQIRALEDVMDAYESPATNAVEERIQHVESLEFHRLLASYSNNELMGFIIRFLDNVLAELTVHKELFAPEDADLWMRGRDYQMRLLEALRRGSKEQAREIMYEHMEFAKSVMAKREFSISSGFI